MFLAALGTAAAAVVGPTLGLMDSAATPQAASLRNGTVVLEATGSSPAGQVCTMSNLTPAESGTCTYSVVYGGSLAGWIGLSVNVVNGNASKPLYVPGNPNDLQIGVNDRYQNAFTPTVGSIPNVQPVAKVENGGIGPVNPDGSVNGGWTDTFTVTYSLPATASGALQGASATVTLQAYAIQESNDPLNACNAPTLGWGTTVASTTCTDSNVAVASGYSVGFWQSSNGLALISADGTTLNAPAILGQWPPAGTELGVKLTTVAESNAVLPGQSGSDACSLLACPSSGALTANVLNGLAAQTLALTYNIAYGPPGFRAETVQALGCTADLGATGLSAGATMSQALAVADGFIAEGGTSGTTTVAEATGMEQLLSCLQTV